MIKYRASSGCIHGQLRLLTKLMQRRSADLSGPSAAALCPARVAVKGAVLATRQQTSELASPTTEHESAENRSVATEQASKGARDAERDLVGAMAFMMTSSYMRVPSRLGRLFISFRALTWQVSTRWSTSVRVIVCTCVHGWRPPSRLLSTKFIRNKQEFSVRSQR